MSGETPGVLDVRWSAERWDILNAPEQIEVSLSALVAANPKAVRFYADVLEFGAPESVTYRIESFDMQQRTFMCRRIYFSPHGSGGEISP